MVVDVDGVDGGLALLFVPEDLKSKLGLSHQDFFIHPMSLFSRSQPLKTWSRIGEERRGSIHASDPMSPRFESPHFKLL